MPLEDKKVFNLINSPPLHEYNTRIGKLKNFSTIALNCGNITETSDLFLSGYNQIYLVK